MRQGMRRGAAAYALGFERKEILDFIFENEEFEQAVVDAEGEATEHVEEALYQAAVSGNVQACRLWLDLRRPKKSTDLVPLQGQDDDDDGGEGDLLALREITH
jgi:hypothetical protein